MELIDDNINHNDSVILTSVRVRYSFEMLNCNGKRSDSDRLMLLKHKKIGYSREQNCFALAVELRRECVKNEMIITLADFKMCVSLIYQNI